jgi:hypothetical protein
MGDGAVLGPLWPPPDGKMHAVPILEIQHHYNYLNARFVASQPHADTTHTYIII